MAGLVFISHDTPDGRTGARNRAIISAHTLGLNRKLKNNAGSSADDKARTLTIMARKKPQDQRKRKLGTCIMGSEGQALSTAAGTSKRATDGVTLRVDAMQKSDELFVIPTASIGPIIRGQDGEDVQSIGRWYFLNQLHGAHASSFCHAQSYWTNGLWEMARTNKPLFAGIAALAAYRDVALATTYPESSYIELKGRTMFHVGRNLSERHTKTDPLTMVAIALLAYMDIRDAQFDTARLHLLAVRNLVDISEMTANAWLACSWVDLRYALLTGQPPILPCYIPPPFRRNYSCCVSANFQTVQRASSNVANCPKTDYLDHHTSFDIFNRLHALCLCSDQLENSKCPPFGQIYDLEYALRVIHSGISKGELQCHTTAAAELIILAAQLHVWMACRFWTPQRQESHLALVSRASSVLDAFSGILVRWTELASVDSLLWIVFTMVATMRIYGDTKLMRMLHHLHSTLTTLGIYGHEEFCAKLNEWPWIGDWHPVQIVHVWAMLTEHFDDFAVSVPSAHDIAVPTGKPPQRLFLGGLEYFNSL
jgi:hypothetical protein